MIFYPLYSKVFVPMVKSGNRFLHFIAYPLGFCIYYSTFWITMLILILFLTSWDSLPKWQDIVIGIIAAEGVAHLIVCFNGSLEDMEKEAKKCVVMCANCHRLHHFNLKRNGKD